MGAVERDTPFSVGLPPRSPRRLGGQNLPLTGTDASPKQRFQPPISRSTLFPAGNINICRLQSISVRPRRAVLVEDGLYLPVVLGKQLRIRLAAPIHDGIAGGQDIRTCTVSRIPPGFQQQ